MAQSAKKIMARHFLTWALPRLVEIPISSWNDAIRNARNIDFDLIERVLIVAGVAFVAYMLRFDSEQIVSMSLPVRYLFQFVAAVPLLLLVIGPVYLRRARRGIDMVIEKHYGRAAQKENLQS
ncbi:MAG: hypothetical protein WC100_16635 [Sterolibacterium sp.]